MAMEQMPLNFEGEGENEEEKKIDREQEAPSAPREEKTYEEKLAEIRAKNKGPTKEFGDSSVFVERGMRKKRIEEWKKRKQK